MMEAEQYGPWLSNCLGYWSEPLKAYSKMKFWTDDPKLEPYAGGDGYTITTTATQGPISAASSAVVGQLHRGGHVRLGRRPATPRPRRRPRPAAKQADALLRTGPGATNRATVHAGDRRAARS